MNALLTLSFVAGLIPATVLFIAYGVFTPWERTSAGRVLFALVAVFEVSYLISVVTLLFPAVFKDTEGGVLIRVVIRFAVAGVLWGLLWLFVRQRRRGEHSTTGYRGQDNGPADL